MTRLKPTDRRPWAWRCNDSNNSLLRRADWRYNVVKARGAFLSPRYRRMNQLAPPQPPTRIALAEHDGLARLNFRLWQVLVTTLTVLFTAWCITLGPIPAIVALVIAKHVLVAILVMGLDIYPRYKTETAVTHDRT